MKSLLIAAALACAPAAALAADAPTTNVSGAWTLNGDVGDGAIKWQAACNLKEDDGGKLSGACKGTQQEDAPVSGSVTGQAVEIAYDTTYEGSPVHLDYKGDLQTDGTIKGTVDTGGPPGTFVGTK